MDLFIEDIYLFQQVTKLHSAVTKLFYAPSFSYKRKNKKKM